MRVGLLAALALTICVGGAEADRRPPQKPTCSRVIAGSLKRSELKVVGTVLQGTKKQLLLIDTSNNGYIVKPTECVARERVSFDELARPRPRL